jgi:hypothetical protein
MQKQTGYVQKDSIIMIGSTEVERLMLNWKNRLDNIKTYIFRDKRGEVFIFMICNDLAQTLRFKKLRNELKKDGENER